MADTERIRERCWEHGWLGHEQAQRRRLAQLTLEQKLEWLEQAHLVVQHMLASRNQLRPPG